MKLTIVTKSAFSVSYIFVYQTSPFMTNSLHNKAVNDLFTVNWKFFMRVLFSLSFVKIKSLRNDEITLSFTDVGNHALVANFNVVNMTFNAICK